MMNELSLQKKKKNIALSGFQKPKLNAFSLLDDERLHPNNLKSLK
jgi:hypothetical protein